MTAEQFKTARLARGLTQKQFAERVGVTPRAVQYYEAGQRDIPRPVEIIISMMA